MATSPKKIEAVTKWPVPQTVYDVRSFLALLDIIGDLLEISAKSLNPSEKLSLD